MKKLTFQETIVALFDIVVYEVYIKCCYVTQGFWYIKQAFRWYSWLMTANSLADKSTIAMYKEHFYKYLNYK